MTTSTLEYLLPQVKGQWTHFIVTEANLLDNTLQDFLQAALISFL